MFRCQSGASCAYVSLPAQSPFSRLSGSLWRLILSISGACWPNGSQEVSGGSFALRKSLEAHLRISGFCSPNGSPAASGTSFQHFWDLLTKSLSGGFWKFILSISGAHWPKWLSGGFSSLTHFEHFWNLLAISGFRLHENMDNVRSTSIKTNLRSLMFGAER